MKLKYPAFGCLIISFAMLVIDMGFSLRSYYVWERDFGSYWHLADKSSTLEAKEQNIEKFLAALKKADMAPNDAVFLRTPNNSAQYNLDCLDTLLYRLRETKGMDAKSFEYNTAIQQITAQEQGEAHNLIDVISGCWTLANYPIVWGWIAATYSAIAIVICVVGVGLLIKWANTY